MLQIRKNVFETNSSSTHSLVISKKDRGYDYNTLPVVDGVLTIPFGEFGWGPKLLKYPIEKLSYLITDRNAIHLDWDKDYEWEEVEKMIDEDKNIQEIISVIKNCCPEVQEVKFEQGDSYNPIGYVDHQSIGTSYEKDLSIEDIIFSNKVIIMIDNDNSYHYEDYFEDTWEGTPAKADVEDLFRK
jgi:hypothetical protein